MGQDYAKIAMCWHEASHTICGLINYINILQVYIISHKYDHGKTSYEMYDCSEIKDKNLARTILLHEIQTLYAGLIGEKLYYKEICGSDNFPMHLRIGSSNDIRDAAKLIAKYKLSEPGASRYQFKKQIQNDVKKIIEDYWSDIKLISHILYRYDELNHDELKYFLTRRSVNKEFWTIKFKDIKKIYKEEKEFEENILKKLLNK